MESKKYDTIDTSTKQKQTHRHREQMCVYQGQGRGQWVKKRRTGSLGLAEASCYIYKKVLPCNTGHYIQYPVINHNGKEYIYS